MRADFEALPESNDPEAEMTRAEFGAAVESMKIDKASGSDKIPAEVWAHSKTAKDILFEFLKQIWRKEEVPENLSVCVFIMIYKNKGSKDDYTKYRVIGLLNHTYKIMSTILLRRM